MINAKPSFNSWPRTKPDERVLRPQDYSTLVRLPMWFKNQALIVEFHIINVRILSSPCWTIIFILFILLVIKILLISYFWCSKYKIACTQASLKGCFQRKKYQFIKLVQKFCKHHYIPRLLFHKGTWIKKFGADHLRQQPLELLEATL